MVWGALALVLRVSRCAGMAPLRLRAAGPGWRAAASPPLNTLNHCVLAALDSFALAALIMDVLEKPTHRIHVGETGLTAFVSISDLVMVTSIANLVIYRGRERMERLTQVLNNLQQINKDLNNDPAKKSEKVRMFMFAFLMVWIATVEVIEIYLHMDSFIHNGRNYWIMLMYTISYYVFIAQGMLALMQWSAVVVMVYDAAALINRQLLRLLHVNLVSEAEESAMLESNSVVDCFTERHHDANNPDDVWSARPSQVRGMVRRLAATYEHIGEVIQQLNAGNGVMLIITVLCNFLHLLETPYYFLLRLGFGYEIVGVVSLLVLWGGVHIFTLLLTIEGCHWTQGQRETTKFLISKLMVHLGPKCQRISQELEQFAKQTLLTNVKFMPLGLYTLARPLMATILGGATTYLVIIIQFQSFDEHF